jgi:predicted NBD/HSP70 family sugar kinase
MKDRQVTPERVQVGHMNQGRGSNLLGVSQYNERLILQLIRRAGDLPKAEIARMTGLSAQTVSVIINRLLASKLLRKQPLKRTKGRVGQPAMPIALNPNGAFSLGVKIGRSSLDILVVNFVGEVLQRISHRYEYPDPDAIFVTIDEGIASLIAAMSKSQVERIVGIGVAAPSGLGGWQQLTGAPGAILERWNHIDIRQRISDGQTLPVWFSNDATAACIAELETGKPLPWQDFLYVFVGTFIGGGTVQNGILNGGSSGNSGAIGSMPIPAAFSGEEADPGGSPVQLIHCASRFLLVNRLKKAGFEPELVIEELGRDDTGQVSVEAVEIFDAWLQNSADAIAFAIVAAVSVMDFRAVVIDGLLPRGLVERLTAAVVSALAEQNMEGLVCPEIEAGTFGNDARAIGGAVLPFYNNFSPDMNVLFKGG